MNRDLGAAAAESGEKTILIADDHPGVRAALRCCLAKEGHRVLEAGDGLEAVAIAAQFDDRIDLLITDVEMPGLDGVEVARNIAEQRRELPVLFVSGSPPDLNQLPDGCVRVQVMAKPFDPVDLVQAVESMTAPSCRGSGVR